jgi:uncharacterized membrane protein YfcA
VVLWKHGIVLGAGGITGVPGGVTLGTRISEQLSLILFAVLMVYIALRMLFPSYGPSMPRWIKCQVDAHGAGAHLPCLGKLFIAGVTAGVLSGLFGVGGGFLLIPALMSVAQVEVQYAMATSLVAIVIISGSGLVSNLPALAAVSPAIPAFFLAGSALGVTIGVATKRLCSPRVLQMVFGLSVLATAVFVLIRNT